MRRKEREIKDINDVIKIIFKANILRLVLMDENKPYIIPLNFAHNIENNKICFYFHSFIEGKKIDLIKNSNIAYFEIDNSYNFVTGEKACEWSMEYESIIGEGEISILSKENKIFALDLIMKKAGFFENNEKTEYKSSILDKTAVLKLQVNNYTAKSNILNKK